MVAISGYVSLNLAKDDKTNEPVLFMELSSALRTRFFPVTAIMTND